MKKIAIDLVTIYPGKGGAGGGINTYAKNLLIHLDKLTDPQKDQFKIYCLCNDEFDLKFDNIEIVKFEINAKKYFLRMIYIHILLPIFCIKNNVNLLHKLASEIPIFSTAPLIVTIHDFMMEYCLENNLHPKTSILESLKIWYFLNIAKTALRKAKYLITPSNTIRKEAISRYKVNPDKIFVAELGAEDFTCVSKTVKEGPINIYYIAAFLPHKGHSKAIKIFQILRDKYNVNAHLHFRGNVNDEAFYNRVMNEVNQSSIKNKIFIINYDKNSSLNEIYSEADCVWLFSEYEGFGLPLLEAQIHGIPVICSDIAIFQEVVSDSAILVKGSDDHIASDIAYFFDDKERWDKLIRKGSLNVSKYSWELFGQKIFNIYKKAIL